VASLRCIGVSKSFGAVCAVRDVAVVFPETGLVAMVGPNGAGKTTLLDLITGFSTPDTGRIYLGDTDITGVPPYQRVRQGVARTFQELRLLDHLSALENVALAFPGQRGEKLLGALLRIGTTREEERNRQKAAQILSTLGLSDHSGSLARTLSYGQRKLLALGRCLSTGARILLLDEPVAGLHPKARAEVLKVLLRLRKDGTLVVFVEHDIALVRSTAELVIAMGSGSVIAQGPPSQVLDRPEVVKAYLG